ncbi:MAG: BMP family protein [Oscillospiraceae bacterium]|nr:BMP family protein [Oscillospiraceae bacterium]
MKKFKSVIALTLVLVLALSCFAACGGQGEGGQNEGGEGEGEKLKIALVLPGKKDDVSFNQAMYRGATEYAEAHPDEVELKVVEGIYEVADIDPTLRDYADAGYDVVIGHGYQFSEPVNTVAAQYPETIFLLGCGVGYQPNSAIYDVQLEAGGYLMGVIAALATQSNKVGVIGGGEGSEITRGHEGFKQGARSINPDIEIQEVYTGDWNDTTGAYEAAIGMYDSGVDVIWHSGDGIGLGVVNAAKEKNMYVLGNVEDQKSLAPENVLSGLCYDWVNALERIFASIKDGSFVTDAEKEVIMINVANGGLTMSEINDTKGWLTEDDLAVIEDVYAKLGENAIEFAH